jgi:hypothetical protein
MGILVRLRYEDRDTIQSQLQMPIASRLWVGVDTQDDGRGINIVIHGLRGEEESQQAEK